MLALTLAAAIGAAAPASAVPVDAHGAPMAAAAVSTTAPATMGWSKMAGMTTEEVMMPKLMMDEKKKAKGEKPRP
jgi:hypothetical protein